MERSGLWRGAGLALVIGGIAILAWALLTGEAGFALVLIIPVIYGSGGLAALAMLMLFAGLVLISLSFVPTRGEEEAEQQAGGEREREFGGVVLIGPIPIVFGSGRALKGSRTLIIMAVLSMAVLALFLIALLR